jgi:integrase
MGTGQHDYRLQLFRKRWHIVWHADGKRNRLSTRTSDHRIALGHLDAFIKSKAETQQGTHTVGELWAMHRAYIGDRPSGKTMDFEWRSMEKWFGALMPSQVTEGLCREFSRARLAENRSSGTVWTNLGRLRMVFAWSVKREYLTKAPYIPRPQQSRPRESYLTSDEALRLLNASETPHLKLFITLAWSTGARASALLGLKWSSIDFSKGRINLQDPSETRRMKGRAIVPMNETARAALVEARRGATSDYVIEYHGKPVASVKKALKRAGARIGRPDVSPHMLRHSAAVAMAEAGIPMREIAQFLGHSNEATTFKVYARFSPDYLSKAAAALELGGTTQRVRVVGA